MAEETRDAKLRLGVETKGVDKSVNDLKGIDREIDKLTKDIRQNFDKSVNSVEMLTDEIRGDLVSAIKEADKAADGIDIKSGGSSGGGGNVPAAAKFRGAASLVGGGELVGLIDDFQDLGEGLVELKSAAPGAIEGLKGLASSVGLTTPMAAALVIGLAAVAAAFALATSEAQKNADVINSTLDKRRELDKQTREGLTTNEAQARIEALKAAREDEAETLADITTAYKDLERQHLGNLEVFRALNVEEEALSSQAGKSQAALADLDAEIAGLEERAADGSLAANDAKVAEQELAQVRETETPKAIDTAVNAERDRAREMEKVAREAERAAAEAAREQERIAAEQQRRAEQAAAAQQKYADGIKNANTALKQATADINTKLSQGLADNLEGMFRDVTDIATQYRRDTFDMDLKANQAERDALTEHYRDIDDIRDDALKSEQEALRDGDFKAAFLAKQAGADAIKQEQKETLRERSDRTRALGDERADLKRNSEQARSDRMLALERQNADTRTAAQRELQQATLTRTRALEMNAASYKSELAALGSFLQQRNNLLATANQAALANIGGRGGAGGLNNTGRSIQQQMAAAVGGIIRR